MGRALGEFEKLVLFAVLGLGDAAYGLAIQDRIAKHTGRAPSSGAVHTTLERLVSRGMVRSRMGSSTPARGGRRKRFYTLTPRGAQELRASYSRLRAMGDPLLEALDAAAES